MVKATSRVNAGAEFRESARKDFRSSVRVVKQRVAGGELQPAEGDFLAIEDPLEMRLIHGPTGARRESPLALTMRTPGHDPELIAGFLFAERIIQCAQDIDGVCYNEPTDCEAPTCATITLREGLAFSPDTFERSFTMTSSCGVCGKTSGQGLALPRSLKLHDHTVLDASLIHELPARMQTAQQTFQQTGGLHAAALFTSGGELLVVREDIGRHNALDKAVGSCLLDGRLPAAGLVLCVSGRMSYEILQKALVARIPIVAGVGAPSSLAVTMANDYAVTLLGFVRGGSYNIYSCPERLRTS